MFYALFAFPKDKKSQLISLFRPRSNG
uniref:Uncharacterized protein n=1 Tax=Rhizophora mucronata TaxID=61149 RepID=A0A2P2NCA5_RHIMU